MKEREKTGKLAKQVKDVENVVKQSCPAGTGPLVGEHRNLFTPTFGMVPPFMAGRTYIIDDILRALDRGPGDPNLSTSFLRQCCSMVGA